MRGVQGGMGSGAAAGHDGDASEDLFTPSRSNTLLEMQVDTGLAPAIRYGLWLFFVTILAGAASSLPPIVAAAGILWLSFLVLAMLPQARATRYTMRVVPEGIEVKLANGWFRVEWERVLRIGGGRVEGVHGAMLVLNGEAMEALSRLAPSHVELVRTPPQTLSIWKFIAVVVVVGLMAIAYQLAVMAMHS